jgi:hypothetical protein
MSEPIILTHCGKLGDMLYALPVAEWFYRQHGRRVHWVLPRCFPPFQYIANLLCLQPHCAGVTLVDHKLVNLDAGGQPYRFNPAHFGIAGEYFNLGFRSYPDRFIPAFYASEYKLGFEPGYRMKIWPDGAVLPPLNDELLRSGESAMAQFAPQAKPLPPAEDLLRLVQRLDRAAEFHTWYCGLAVLAYFAGIPQHVYRVPGHARRELYFPGEHPITWHEVTL